MPQNHILFLTSNNLASNPRIYKEVQLAIGLGYRVTLLQYRLGNWSDVKNKLLELDIAHYEIRQIQIDATSDNKFFWLKWGLLEKVARIIYPFVKNNLLINALASSRRSIQILKACKNIEKPDLIISHNLGAAYPAYKLSSKWKIPFIFDVEDYHPGEAVKEDGKNEKMRREFLLKTILPKAKHVTFASLLIKEYTLKLIGNHPNAKVVPNSFSEKEFKPPNSSTNLQFEPLNLVWFSQKISFGRGLEQLFEALFQLYNSSNFKVNSSFKICLTLIGDIDADFFKKKIQPFKDSVCRTQKSENKFHILSADEGPLTNESIQLKILPPLPQEKLHNQLANYDVGLALEFNNTDLNRQLCLTNKIIAYSQAGLFILATNTPAQEKFITEDPSRGLLCEQTSNKIASAIFNLINKSNEIKNTKIKRYKKGQSLAWENELSKLSSIWSNLTE